ncbi:MAG: hypothetical protein AMK71_04845 [Nitrospira bacterium SG8_35_4]|nr:MAG: hypothetical protein AMK71_04845 [Nitrospira bacterium SG8_35_4]
MKNEYEHNRRQCERVPVNEGVCFFDTSGRYLGTLMDCSPKGMLIKTRGSFPSPSQLQVVIFTGKELLNVPAHVVRVNEKEGEYTGIGVKVPDNSAKFTQFVVRRALRGVHDDLDI